MLCEDTESNPGPSLNPVKASQFVTGISIAWRPMFSFNPFITEAGIYMITASVMKGLKAYNAIHTYDICL